MKRTTTDQIRTATAPPAPPRKAYSYLRFSTPEQSKGDSLRRQTTGAEEYVKRSGGRLELDTSLTYQDQGISAFRGKNSETGRLGDFLEAVRGGLVPQGSVLLVESLDRISRQTARLAVRVLEDICDAGVAVVTLTDGREYTKEALDRDAMSFIIAVLTFVRANEESETKSSRLKAAWSAKRERATAGESRLTSMLPAWLATEGKESPIRVVPERAKVVREVFRMYAEGKGIVGIARTLNAGGTPTFPAPNGAQAQHWHPSYVNRLIRNPAVIGSFQPTVTSYVGRSKRRKPTGESIPGYFPSIIDDDLWSAVQAMLSDTRQPGRGKQPKAGLQNLLGGLGSCANCGSSMRRKTMSSKLASGERKVYSYLVCSRAMMAGKGCAYEATPYEPVEAALLNPRVFARMVPAPKSGGLEERLELLEESLNVATERRGEILSLMLETGSRAMAGDLAEAEAEVERLRAERDDMATKVDAALPKQVAYRLNNLRATLAEEPLDRPKANAMLRAVLSRVVIDAEAREGVLVWKHGGESSFVFGVPEEKKAKQRRG